MDETMEQGVIKVMFQEKGFGFIQSPGASDVFFHHSVVADRGFDDLKQGQEVHFSLKLIGKKGPRATSVVPVAESYRRAA